MTRQAAGTAWVLGASGFWGQKICLSLLRQNWRIIGFCRREPIELLQWAEAQGAQFSWRPFDLEQPDWTVLSDETMIPQAFFHCAAVFDEADLSRMMTVNVTTPVALMEKLIATHDVLHLGVFLGQNGRLGLPGLGLYSATQGALWTWAEAQQRALKKEKRALTLSMVFPPRAPSDMQKQLAARLDKPPKVKIPKDADDLVRGVLAGKRRVGRKPVIAGLATLLT